MRSRQVGAGGGEEPASLQALLSCDPPGGREAGASRPSIADPVALFRHLEASGRFHRDTGFGRLFHPGRVSLRENIPSNSLHVVIEGNHIAAHVDRVSPLGLRPERPSRYSLRRAAAHNLDGMAQDFVRLVRGRQGDHRSALDCEWLHELSPDLLSEADLLDRATSAWSVQVEAQVTGMLDETRLRGALRAVLGDRHPDHELLVVPCPEESDLDAARTQLQGHPAGLTDWPPLRAALARHPAGDLLMLNINHAACDGFDALRLLQAIASSYASGTAPEAPFDVPAVYELPVRPASAPVSVWAARYRSAVERLRDLLARPAQLAVDEDRDDPGFGFHLVCLSAEQSRQVVSLDRYATSRSFLLAGLHRAIGEWNAQHGAPGRRVGVLAPIDLRPPDWPEGRIGNFSVTARVSTSRRHRRDVGSALRAVAAQTIRNKRTRTGIALLAGLERSGLLPLWSKQSRVVLQPVTRNHRVDTALLANLGHLEEAPSFGERAGETVHVWFSLPARTPMTLCVGAVTLSGRLHLVLRYPRRLFSADAARRFGDCLVDQVTGSGQLPRS